MKGLKIMSNPYDKTLQDAMKDGATVSNDVTTMRYNPTTGWFELTEKGKNVAELEGNYDFIADMHYNAQQEYVARNKDKIFESMMND